MVQFLKVPVNGNAKKVGFIYPIVTTVGRRSKGVVKAVRSRGHYGFSCKLDCEMLHGILFD